MKVILDIKDNKAPFVIEVLKNLKGVKVIPLTGYKADVLEGLKETAEEVKRIRSDK